MSASEPPAARASEGAPPAAPAAGAPAGWWSVRFAVAVCLVAIAAGSFAILFRATLEMALRAVSGVANVVDAMIAAAWWWRLIVPALGALAAGCVSLAIAKRPRIGVGDVMEAVALGRTRLSLYVTAVKSGASWCAIVSGNSIGREGPLIQFGGAAGQDIGDRFGLDERHRRVLIAAGTAAGFAAAYNTPLAAVVFVLEIVTGIVVVETVLPTLVATVIATMMTRAAVGAGPIYGQREFLLTSAGELVAYAGIGVAAALVAFGFNRLVHRTERAFRRSGVPLPWRPMLGGLGAGAILVGLPMVAGNGYEPLNRILDGTLPIRLVAMILLAKCVATALSVGSGNPGGVFTPTLLIGGCTGYLAGAGIAALGFDVGLPGGYALVGMAAAIAAATHAPLMAAVLAFELSGDYAVVLPLVLATAVGTAVARGLGRDSIYTAELRERGVAWEAMVAPLAPHDAPGDAPPSEPASAPGDAPPR